MIDQEQLCRVVREVPPGHWISYLDLAAAAGAPQSAAARSVNRLLIKLAPEGAYRVLKSDGSVSSSALGDPDGVADALAADGLELVGGRAPQDRRFRPARALEALKEATVGPRVG
jgi:alkylated DNA nucleotide flippase Atl1